MLILISMTLTLIQGHSGLAEETFSVKLIVSTNKEAITIKRATAVGDDN